MMLLDSWKLVHLAAELMVNTMVFFVEIQKILAKQDESVQKRWSSDIRKPIAYKVL